MNFLEFLLSSNKYDIICLVETFLTVDDRDSLYLIGGKNYTLFRYDKLIHRGGVAIFCKSSLCPVRNFISHIDVQYIHLKINSKIPFNIICVYRPPNCNEVSHEQICKLFDITQQNYNSSIIIGVLIYQILIGKIIHFLVTQKVMHYFSIRLLKIHFHN